jgi:hypothetical protein
VPSVAELPGQAGMTADEIECVEEAVRHPGCVTGTRRQGIATAGTEIVNFV